MTAWKALIERAAYTCFSKSGSLDFRLARGDLQALAREVAEIPALELPPDSECQVRLPVALGGQTVMVLVEEWTG